jgi:hypothetical protein
VITTVIQEQSLLYLKPTHALILKTHFHIHIY